MNKQAIARVLYKKLLALYPLNFREQFSESIEQTFNDLYNEHKRWGDRGLFGPVLWMFLETAIGIFREHLLLISPGDSMQTVLSTLGSSTLISFLLILPFMVMEVVNRRLLNEEFPVVLFLVMWLNLFAISLILLPIVRSRRIENPDLANPVPAQRNTLFTNPRSAAIISVSLILFPFLLSWLDSLSWVPLDLGRVFNGPNPEVTYLPGQILAFSLFAIPIAAGIIAGGPVVRTLRAGGSLFAHPIHLILIALIVVPMAFGMVSLIIDQWPCFMGVPNCD